MGKRLFGYIKSFLLLKQLDLFVMSVMLNIQIQMKNLEQGTRNVYVSFLILLHSLFVFLKTMACLL